MGSLMVVASTSLIIPAALNMAFDNKGTTSNGILILSRGTSIVLLILYVLYLYFQFQTHSRLFEQADANVQPEHTDARREKQEYALPPQAALAALLAITISIAVCAEYLVGTIDDLAHTLHINKTFIGMIILPVVGNAAEQVTAVVAAAKDKLDLALGVALGSSLQIALFVTPSLVVLGWIINQPMSLCFEPFDAVVFFLSVLVVNGLVSDGESNYLEGAMLVGTYATLLI
jgi:Ca2+:H+ antiporter